LLVLTRRAVISSVPPRGMASRAFSARFSIVWVKCVRSSRTFRPRSASITSLIPRPSAASRRRSWSSSSPIPITLPSGDELRLNASICPDRSAARPEAASTSSSAPRTSSALSARL
jgi:hypothetical protein